MQHPNTLLSLHHDVAMKLPISLSQDFTLNRSYTSHRIDALVILNSISSHLLFNHDCYLYDYTFDLHLNVYGPFQSFVFSDLSSLLLHTPSAAPILPIDTLFCLYGTPRCLDILEHSLENYISVRCIDIGLERRDNVVAVATRIKP